MKIPSPALLCEAMHYADQAYSNRHECADCDSWVKIENKETGAEAVITRVGPRLFIAFTGTEPEDLRDWWTDLKVSGSYFAVLEGDVHRGFLKAYNALRYQVLKTVLDNLDDNYGLEIICVGHSMGGALAVLCHADMLAYSDNVASYTFGAPALFSSRAAAVFKSHCGTRSFRVVYFTDIVPRIVYIVGWKHGNHMLYIDTKGKIHNKLQRATATKDFFKFSLKRLRVLRDAFKSHTRTMYKKMTCQGS